MYVSNQARGCMVTFFLCHDGKRANVPARRGNLSAKRLLAVRPSVNRSEQQRR